MANDAGRRPGNEDAHQGREGSERDDGQDHGGGVQDLRRGGPRVLCHSFLPLTVATSRTSAMIGAAAGL
jgi:hypothetical protein